MALSGLRAQPQGHLVGVGQARLRTALTLEPRERALLPTPALEEVRPLGRSDHGNFPGIVLVGFFFVSFFFVVFA